ncbi:MAG TPA: amidohydrolase family protein [Ktedonobacteraceae bacterium]|nr:amidohydrolase family protein [Ktedonobacteraceae bacterium]
MIIDCHCHAGKGDGFRGPWDTDAPLEPHLRRARQAGISKTIVFPVFNSDYAAANARLARIVRSYPGELIGFAAIHPVRDAGRVGSMIRLAVEDYGFRGLKIHGFDAFPGREVCEAARLYRLPLLVDVVGRLSAVEMLAWQYPDLNFIIPHLGGFKDDWMVHTHLVDQLRRFPNVYADTSGVRYWECLVQAVKRAGPQKIIFGSDGPLLHPALELQKVKLLGLPAAEEALITGGNIARLLREVRSSVRLDTKPARLEQRSLAYL